MTRTESIASLYATMTGKDESDITKSDLTQWLDLNSSVSLETINASMLKMDGALVYPSGTDAYVKSTFEAVFGYIPNQNAAGFAYWVDELDSGSVSADTLAIALLKGAAAQDEQRAIDKIDAAVGNLTASQTIYLTTDHDVLEGGVGNDTFIADIIGNTDSAQSGDRIDGGAGEDTLHADVGNYSNFAITLRTDSVENFSVRAQSQDWQSNGDNNLNSQLSIDAERMDGTDRYETNNSRADVIIEDVRIEDDQITKDITIAMVQTDPGNVDFGVYFDQHSLRNAAEETSGAGLELEVMDITNALATGEYLKKNPFDKILFKIGGEEVHLELDIAYVRGDYDLLVDGINLALTEYNVTFPSGIDLTTVTAEITGTFTGTESATSTVVTGGQTITLTTSDDRIFEALGWVATGVMPPNTEFLASQSLADPSASTFLITSTIILDDVGRGSMGGDLIVGGLSTGVTSDSTGVEQFDITVERSSELGIITSTANTLEEVYIVNGTTKGNLVVEGSTASSTAVLPGITSPAAGFTDVRVIDASTMEGSVSIDAELTKDVVTKYMNSKDVTNDAASDNIDFIYNLGTNDDTLTLEISNSNLAAAGTTTREDFDLTINGNAGNDIITTVITDDGAGVDGAGVDGDNWYENSEENANLTIDGGSGNDTITTTGAGNFTINAGSGDDTVYTNNDGITTTVTSVNEQQTLTFSDTGAAAGSIIVHGVTIALGTNMTGAAVAAAVAIALDNVHLDFTNGDSGSAIATANTVLFTFDDFSTTAAADKAPIVVTEALATEVGVIVAGGGGGANFIAGTAEVTNVTVAVAGAVGDTITFNGTTVTLVDTDTSGIVEIAEIAAQLAAATYANYTVTDFDAATASLQLTAGAVGADLSATNGNAAGGVNLAAGDFVATGATTVTPTFAVVGNVSAGANGTDDTPAVQEAAETLTFTAATYAGSIVINVDTDGDGAFTAADTAITVALAAGDTADAVGVKVAAALDSALTASGWIVAEAAGVVSITPPTALGVVAPTTMVDGTQLAATTISETTKGVASGSGDAATWVVNAVNTDVADLDSSGLLANSIIFDSTLTVTYTGSNQSNGSGITSAAAVALSNGFESTVVIPSTTNLGNQSEINQAIKDAINNDSVMSQLLVANDGPANTLVITSLTDGEVIATDLAITMSAPTSLTSGELISLNSTRKDLANDSSLADINEAAMITLIQANLNTLDTAGDYATPDLGTDNLGVVINGVNSVSVSDNTINLGSGNDVLVLGTDATSNDTIVFTGSNIGENTLFNMTIDGGTATDYLDFTSYLNSEEDIPGSGSDVSQTHIANTIAANSDLSTNEVFVNNAFAQNIAGTATETWANLTEADVFAAINSTTNTAAAGDYGNITAASLTVQAAAATEVSTTAKNIYMVENDLNDGEYKVFEITSNTATTIDEFTAVNYLGVIDFGNTVSLNTADLIA